jgi:hypothetical protein
MTLDVDRGSDFSVTQSRDDLLVSSRVLLAHVNPGLPRKDQPVYKSTGIMEVTGFDTDSSQKVVPVLRLIYTDVPDTHRKSRNWSHPILGRVVTACNTRREDKKSCIDDNCAST